MATMVNGIKYNLVDDIDTLICKLQNKVDDFYINDVKCDIETIESDLKKLEIAFEEGNMGIMQKMLDKYHTLFERYR